MGEGVGAGDGEEVFVNFGNPPVPTDSRDDTSLVKVGVLNYTGPPNKEGPNVG